jgi:hypothetical protein
MVQEKSIGHWQGKKLKSPFFGTQFTIFVFGAEKRFLLLIFFYSTMK